LILPAQIAGVLSGMLFIVGTPWVAWAVFWQLAKGKGTPVPAIPTKYFLKNGPYRFMRNPMMGGFFLYLLGWAFYWNQWGPLIAALGMEILLYLWIKFIEEPELTIRFGDAYREYKKETPFMIPKLR
jgi:protein-S-isoprenylcysteine O-methyltransferase Ste14